MPSMKLLKEPGFLYDLNYLFYLKFNMQECIDSLAADENKEENVKYLKEILEHFGDISEDLYVFYHTLGSDRCFISTYYLDPYKEQFATDFNFKYFKNLLSDTDKLMENMIRFYLSDLSEDEIAECISSNAKLFSCIKESSYSGDEKSKLYEFFINPAPYLQALQYELIEKEILLSAYYKDNYDKIIEAHNGTTFELLCKPVKYEKDISFLNNSDQVLYLSFCLLHKYHMALSFVNDGAIYVLGYDYKTFMDEFANGNKGHTLADMCDALREENRMQILELLLKRDEVPCKDLEKTFNFSGSTAYHHISILTRSGAVKIRTENKLIYYSLNRKYFDTLRERLKKFSNDKKG
ncbi:MAG: helix-turn-helix transcriptional regulator [Clostridia bacterium]|nr:helix-turn-helix transcriptional regulator [Clostridia bacterium]